MKRMLDAGVGGVNEEGNRKTLEVKCLPKHVPYCAPHRASKSRRLQGRIHISADKSVHFHCITIKHMV